MNPGNANRLLAIEQGRKTYIGKPCRKCSQSERYVNGSGCVSCIKAATAERDPKIGARYQSSSKGKARTKLRKQGVLSDSSFDVIEYKRKEKAKYVNSKESWTAKQLSKYGLTIEQFDQMYEDQNGCCSLCFTHQDNLKIRLSVDHCHSSGKVRSLLCTKCNMALGLVNENVDILKRMSEYVIKHKENSNF